MPRRMRNKLINAKRQAEKRKPPIFDVCVTRSGIEPRPPARWADALTTTRVMRVQETGLPATVHMKFTKVYIIAHMEQRITG